MIQEPRCRIRKCEFYRGIKNDGDELSERPFCMAFPDGIPEFIAYGSNLHLKRVKGDHGIIFKKRKD